jgi:hypothetical protein
LYLLIQKYFASFVDIITNNKEGSNGE